MATYKVDVHYTASVDGCQCVEVEAENEAEATEAALHAFDRHSAWEEGRGDHQFRLVAQPPERVGEPPARRKQARPRAKS